MNLRGKVAVVTGAGAGIGRAVCLSLAAKGARVVAADLMEDWAVETAKRVREAGGQAEPFRVDVTREDDLKALFEFTEKTFGGMDVLLNNAGILGGPRFPDAHPRYWQRAIDVNVLGVAYGIHHGVPLLRRRGGGVIVNTGAEVSFDLWESMAFDIAPGDTFTVTAGCDKSLDTCIARFNNVANFRGFPFIPGNDAVMSYPNTGDRNDGKSRLGG